MSIKEEDTGVPFGMIAGGVTLAVAAALFARYFTTKFAELFAGFGAELPALTALVINHHRVFWLLPLLTLVVAVATKAPRARGIRSFMLGLIGGIAVCALVVVAMYLPIVKMGGTTAAL